jgi:hypothetical protein
MAALGRRQQASTPTPVATAISGAMSAAGIGALRASAGTRMISTRPCERDRLIAGWFAAALDAGLDENLRPAPRYRLRVRRNTPCSPKKFQIQGSP